MTDRPFAERAPHDVRELHEFRLQLMTELSVARAAGDAVNIAECERLLAKLNEQAAAKADAEATK